MTLYLAYGNKVVKYMEYSYLLINYSFEGTCKWRCESAGDYSPVRTEAKFGAGDFHVWNRWQNTWRLSPGDVGAQSI